MRQTDETWVFSAHASQANWVAARLLAVVPATHLSCILAPLTVPFYARAPLWTVTAQALFSVSEAREEAGSRAASNEPAGTLRDPDLET